jgi:hypothetical protein
MRGTIVGIKENLSMVKEELNTEEQFFESAVKTERFVKKYKKPLIGTVAAAVILIAAGSVYDLYRQNRIEQSNAAFAVLQKKPADEAAKKELRSLNRDLFDVWSLSLAIKEGDKEALQTLQKSKALAVSDLAAYELAVLNQDNSAMEKYVLNQDAIYKDLALIEQAVLLMEAGDVNSAHEKLDRIDRSSAMYQLSRQLFHYGVK